MPAPSPARSTTIDDAPLDVLECALAMMIEDEQHEFALLFLERHPTLLGYVRSCTDPASAFTDYPPLKARFPRLVFHLQARRARALVWARTTLLVGVPKLRADESEHRRVCYHCKET